MSKRQSKTPLIYALEPRLLFDGDLGADVASAIVYRDGNATDTAPAVAPENQRENQRETQRENISFEFHSTRSAIVFIDGGVEDPQTLADAAADVLPDDALIHILDGDSDGFAQINDILQNHDRVDEIHIFGHGTAGEVRLGTASLSLETLTTHSGTLAVLKDTLTEDGDILLYGCNIAAGENGQTFIEELAELTAADIAASDDITGAGGDWELEGNTGPIEANTIQARDYQYFLANGIASVNSNTVDKTPSSGSLNVKASPDGGISDSQDRWMVMLEKSNITEADTLYFDENVSVSSYNVSSSTPVASYLVALNDSANRRTQSTGGQVTFEHDILGIYTHKNNTLKSGTLESTGNNNVTTLSNSYFSNSSWTYPTAGSQTNQRDFEGSFGSYGNGNWVWSADGNDHAAWSSNSRTLYLAAKNGNSTGTGDFVRVITKWEVPGPTAQDDFAFVNEGGTVTVLNASNGSGVTGGFTDANDPLPVNFSGSTSIDVEGVHFNNDGTKLYLNDQESGNYQQYSLSTPFDVSAATWDSRTFNGPDGSRGLAFNSDGTKAFTVNYLTDLIYEYSLSSAFNIDTASQIDSLATAIAPGATDSIPEDLAFNSDGTKLYYLEQQGERIYQLNLSTAYDISAATDGGYLDVSAEQNGNNWNSGLAISSDGRKLFAIDNQKTVFEWFLQTEDDITSAALVGERTYSSFGDLTGISFSNDGTKAFMADATVSNNEDAVEFNASIPFSNIFAAGGYSGDLLHTSRAASQDSGANLFVNGFRVGGIEGQGTFSHSNHGSLEGNYGTLTMQTTGAYSYTANSDITNLDAGEVVYDQFNYKAQDGDGNYDQAVLTITIVGQDDPNQPPTISTAAVDPIVNEAVDASSQVLSGSGTIVFADDTDSSLTITAQTSSTVSASSGVTLSNTLQNTLALAITLTDNGDNTANWTLNADGLDLDFLAVDDSITIENVVTATDDDGETVTDTITVTITGTNDGPVAAPVTATVAEDKTTAGASLVNATLIGPSADTTGADGYQTGHQTVGPYDMSFSADGLKLFVVGSDANGKKLITYNLTVAWEVNDWAYASEFDLAPFLQDNFVPGGMEFNDDGTVMFVSEYNWDHNDADGRLHSFNLSTAYDLSTASLDSSITIPDTSGSERFLEPGDGRMGLEFSSDGFSMFMLEQHRPKNSNTPTFEHVLKKFTLSTAWDISTADMSNPTVHTFLDSDDSDREAAFTFNGNGSRLFVLDVHPTSSIREYSVSSPYNISDLSLVREMSLDSEWFNYELYDIALSADESNLYLSGFGGGLTGGYIYQYSVNDSALINDTDPEGDALTLTHIDSNSVSAGTTYLDGTAVNGQYGVLTIGADGTYLYVADDRSEDPLNAGETVTDSFVYTVSDGSATSTANFVVTVTGVNDAPTAADNTVTTNEDEAHTFADSEFNFADVDVEPLDHITIATLPATGTLTLSGTAVEAGDDIAANQIENLVYTPAANGNGDPYTSFTFTVNDGTVDSASSYTMTVDVTPVNDAPTLSQAAIDQTIAELDDASSQDLSRSGTITFADAEDTNLTITGADPATVTAGSGVFIPSGLQGDLAAAFSVFDNNDNTASWALNTAGLDLDFLAAGQTITLDYVVTATDAEGLSVTDTITATITGTNDAPTTDNYQVRVNARNIINGAVFTPANTTKIFSTDDFPFTDAEDAEFTNIRISSLLDYPSRGNLEYSNDSGSSFTAVTQGLVVSHADIASGYLRYAPTDNIHGLNHFRFEAEDSSGVYSAEALIQITTNAAPRESGTSGVPNIAPGESTLTSALFNSWPSDSSDPDDLHSNVRVSGTAPGSNNALITDGTGVGTNVAGTYGTFTIDASGTYVYTANTSNSLPAGSTGIDDFEIFVRDDEGDDPNGAGSHAYGVFTRSFEVDASAQTTSTPVAADDTIDATSGTPETGSVLDNDSDPDGTTPTVSAIETGSVVGGGTAGTVGIALTGTYGALTLNEEGAYTYTVDVDNADILALGADDDPLTETFIYTITDGTETDTATITVNVSGVNDAPTATNETVYINERNLYQGDGDRTPANTSKIFTASDFASFSDIEDNNFSTIRISSLETDGALQYSSDGSSWADVTENQIISYADINSGRLRFTPDRNVEDDVSLGFQLSDSADAYTAEQTMTISVNAAPTASNYSEGGSGIDAGATDTGNIKDVQISDSDDADEVLVLTGLIAGGEFSNWDNDADFIADGTGIGTNVTGLYGTLQLASNGDFTYTADASNDIPVGDTALDDFTYTVRDDETNAGSFAYDVGTISFRVNGFNDPPVPVDDTINATSGTPETGSVLDNDSDPDGTTPTVSAIETGSVVGGGTAGTVGIALTGTYGALTLNEEGAYTYTVDVDNADILALGADDDPLTETFIYTITDGAETDTATITVNVFGVNDAPIAIDDTGNVEVGTEFSGNVLTTAMGGEDVELDAGDSFQVDRLTGFGAAQTISSTPGSSATAVGTYGTITLSEDGSVTYNADQAAAIALGSGQPAVSETFNYRISDTAGETGTGTITFTVSGINDAPAVSDDNGTPDDTSDDTANAATVSTVEDTAHTFSADDFNFTDIDTDDTLASVTITSLPDKGTLTLNGAEVTLDTPIDLADLGNLEYTPLDDENGDGYTSFAYTVSDGELDSPAATMTINVTPDNDAPAVSDDNGTPDDTSDDTANAATVSTVEDTAHTFSADDFNFTDIDTDDTLASVTITSLPDKGTLTLNGAEVTLDTPIDLADLGNLEYTPLDDENGDGYTSFAYTVSDGELDSPTATMTINVTPDNDAPVVSAIADSKTEDEASFDTDLLFGQTDPDGDTLSVSGTPIITAIDGNGDPFTLADGIASVTDSTLTVDPTLLDALGAGESVDVIVTYDVSDGTTTAQNTATITVTGVNDAPTANDDTGNVTVGSAFAGNVLNANMGGEDTDPDTNDALNVSAFETAAGVSGTVGDTAGLPALYGTLVLNSDGSLTYDADLQAALDLSPDDAAVTDSFTYTISDGNGGTETATLSFSVTAPEPGNAPPVVDPIAITKTENDAAFTTDLLAGQTDPNGGTLSVSGQPVISAMDNSGNQYPWSDATISLSDNILSINPSMVNELDDGESVDFIVTYNVSDGALATQNTATITVTGVNDAPIVAAITETTTEDDAPFSIDLMADQMDPDGDDKSIGGTPTITAAYPNGDIYTLPEGAATIDGDNLTIDPSLLNELAEGESIDITVNYNVSDGTNDVPNTATITVTGVNDAPVGDPLTVSKTENDPSFGLNLLSGQSDPDGDTLSVSGTPTITAVDGNGDPFTLPDGIASVTDSTLTVDPTLLDALGAGESVDVIVTYDVSDGTTTTQNTATITVTGVNDAPTADDNTIAVAEDGAHTFAASEFKFDDIDVGDSLAHVTITSLPAAGSLTLNGEDVTENQTITANDIPNLLFTPDANDVGSNYASFTFTVNDGTEDSASAYTMSIDVTDENDAPEVVAITDSKTEDDAAFTTDLTLNQTDPENDDLSVTGTPVVTANFANGDRVTLPAGTVSIDGNNLTIDPTLLDALAQGDSLDINVAYEISDGELSTPNTATITVTGLNDAPTSTGKNLDLDGEAPIHLGFEDFAFDDIDGDDFDKVTIVTAPENGMLLLNGVEVQDGDEIPALSLTDLVYQPGAGASGSNYDAFTFNVSDGQDDSPPYTMTVGVNAAPTASDDAITLAEDSLFSGQMAATDMENNPLTYHITRAPQHGTVTITGAGPGYIYKPDLHYYGTDSFSFEASDGTLTDTGDVSIDVTPENDRPAQRFTIPDVNLMDGQSAKIFITQAFAEIDALDPSLAGFNTAIEKLYDNGRFRTSDHLDNVPDRGKLTYSVSGLPDGLELDGRNRISGVSDELGVFPVVVTATDGEGMSRDINFKLTVAMPMIDRMPDKIIDDTPKRENNKAEEKTPELNDHDMPPVLKVKPRREGITPDRTIMDSAPAPMPEMDMGGSDGDNDLLAGSWLNTRVSSQQDVSGNIRVVDLKVQGEEIAVQLTDQAVDRAERFKGEMSDGKSLPDWISVDPTTGLTTAAPPSNADAVEINVIAEDGSGNQRAINLIIDPKTLMADAQSNAEPAPRPEGREVVRTQTEVNVLANGRVKFTDGLTASEGTMKLMRMVADAASVKIEITDAEKENNTRYQVRQKDGNAAPDWVQVNEQTGELTIEAPDSISEIELTLVATGSGEQRSIELEVNLDEMRNENETENTEQPTETSTGALEGDETSHFVPLNAQIENALAESQYGRDIQYALQENA